MKLEDVVDGNWCIVNGIVNVDGDVDIYSKSLTEIPWRFGGLLLVIFGVVIIN